MNLKKMGLLFLVVLCFPLLFVKAKEVEPVCTIYKNYYFFNEINTFDVVEKNVELNDGQWQRQHRAYFPNADKVDGSFSKFFEHEVCIGISGCSQDMTWTMEKFYNEQKKMYGASGTDSKIVVDDNEYNYRTYQFEDVDGAVVTYYSGFRWLEEIVNGATIIEGEMRNGGVDYSHIDTSALVSGSFIPSVSQPSFDFKTGNDYVVAIMRRTILTSDIFDDAGNRKITPFSIAWSAGSREYDSVLTPGLYYMTYEKCEDAIYYDAKINYYFEGTTEEASPAWEASSLVDGYTETVKSPEVDNCTPDKTSVNVKIDSKDFVSNVYYTCVADTPEGGSPTTGSAFLYFVVIACIVSLGVGIWYFRKNNSNV